jgi:hypothetical protein
MVTFEDDDHGYLAWLAAHPNGYVVNTTRPPSRRYLKLHAAICRTIRGVPPNGTTWTAGQYAKICAPTRGELGRWARRHFGANIDHCGHCFC